ncbi:acetyltransferase [Gynuella sunshinyii YC6258]|uniref:Acetyltransferase n=1 Tax=Gynuella sunshinyii YC6258 TaxID=1445510 RepID=A0A0C5VMP0_9GAMM|nr:GNAT family N-acetyltransferase [Gynuella sunshinyii]AJQ95997.1 acetyltransferase [Gynuella sunshinyii YC6258]
MSLLSIREAVVSDSGQLLQFIKELACYEKAEQEVVATVEDIERSIFGPDSTVEALLCEQDGKAIGFAVYFYNYSTWLGKNGLYLEDLYISPEYRHFGAGKRLLKYLAQQAVAIGCERFEWSVLRWNEPAIRFYESIGAKAKEELLGYRLSGQALLDFSHS